MRPNEIVIREVKRNGGLKVFDLLAECVSQASQPFHVKARGRVESFNVRRANQIKVRMARDFALLAERDRWRTIAALLDDARLGQSRNS